MPIIITGQGGGADTSGLVAGLQAGRADKRADEEARKSEEAYQFRLQQAVQQMKLNDMRLEGMQADQRANETFGELMTMVGDIKGSGDPADAAFFDVAMNTMPQAASMWHRLVKDDPELGMRFRNDFLERAQRAREVEEMQTFFDRAQKAEGTFLPEGWTQQAAQDVQTGGRSMTEMRRAYVTEREKYGKAQAQAEENQGQLAKLDEVLQLVEGDMDSGQRSEIRSLRAQLMAESEIDPGAPLDKNLYGRLIGLVTGAQSNDYGAKGVPPTPVAGQPVGQQMLQPPPAEPTPTQDRTMGGQQYDPYGGVNAQGAGQAPPTATASGGAEPAKTLTAARRRLLVLDAAQTFPLGNTQTTAEEVRQWAESRGLNADQAAQVVSRSRDEQRVARDREKTQRDIEEVASEYRALSDRNAGRGDAGLSPRQVEILDWLSGLPPEWLTPEARTIVESNREPSGPITGVPQ